MGNGIEDEGTIRRYLLGQISEDERQQLEERIMTDTELFNRTLMVEDELVDEYVNGELSGSELKGFEASFLSTQEGRKQVSFAKALGKYVSSASASEQQATDTSAGVRTGAKTEERTRAGKVRQPVWWRRPALVPYFRMATAAVIVVGLGFGIWRMFFFQSDVAAGEVALVRAYNEQRPLEARISGFTYAPAADTRGGQEKVDTVSRDLAANVLLNAVAKHPSPAAHHALGKFYLANREFDKAIAQFEEALKTNPNNAQVHCDYGAALLEKGRMIRANNDKSGVDVEVLARGLEHLNRALVIDPELSEALFNRALLREQMMLMDLAAEDWRAYLERDPSGPWAEEARQRLDRLEETRRRTAESRQNVVEIFLNAYRSGDAESVWTHFSPNREKLISELLATYLKCADRSPPNSCRDSLDPLVYAGAYDLERAGDTYTRDLARFYRAASRKQVRAAIEAMQLINEAQRAYGMARVERAAELRDRARSIFSKIGDRCSAQLATYWLALHYWELGRTQQSLSLIEPLVRASDADDHLWLRARALHLRGGIAFKFGEYSQAISYETKARQIAESLSDSSLAASARSAVIEHYRLLGNQEACLREVSEGRYLLGAPTLTLLALWRQYDILATAFNTFGYFDTAIEYGREALRLATAAGDFVTVASCQAHLGLFYGRAGRFDEALKIVQQAYNAGAEQVDQSLGPAVMAYASLQMGHLFRSRGDFTKARDFYDHTLELHERSSLDFSARLFQAYKGRLACLMALNDTEGAQRQLTKLLELMNQHRAKILEEDNRDSFFDVEQNVYDMGIDLAYSKLQDGQKAFEYAEESRARSLLDSMNANSKMTGVRERLDRVLQPTVSPLPLAQIQARIPNDTRLLEFAVLDDKLLVWVVSQNDANHVAVPVSQTVLTETILRFLDALQVSTDAERGETVRLATELFEYLILPVEPLLDGCHTLIVVPDKILNRLPWDALMSPDSKRFLLEDYLVTLAPSATLFALCTDIAGQRADKREERILSVGDPLFDARAFPKLRSLGAAAHEAQKVADCYSTSSSLLLGPAASESAIRADIARVDVAHFALHCVVDDRSAMRSALVLADEPSTGADDPTADGQLQAHEIYGLRLPRMRLAVLSACQTGVERYYRGEGMIGLARAFQVAGVPLVVASLWPVDSRATAELMIRFHEARRREPLSTAKALWKAKQSLLLHSDGRYQEPYYWAAFEIIGGLATF